MINVTEAAAIAIKETIAKHNLNPDSYVRIAIRGGGCSGFNYLFDITMNKKESDEIFLSNSIKIIVDNKSLLYIDGLTIDYKDEIMGQGFIFQNPNQTSQCGCGQSFSV